MKGPQNNSEGEERGKLTTFIKDPNMISILNRKGIVKLLPVQYSTFDLIYQGEDVIAKDRTGSGKTLAFTLPVITRMREKNMFKGFPTVKFMVVLPTRELAIQVKDEMNSVKLNNQDDFVVAAVYGGAGIQEQLHMLNKGADIIVGTPGRLIDFLERKAIKLHDLQVLCLDEADEMLNIGFKEDIQKIFEYITWARKQKVQCLMFSATIPDWIWKMSSMYQSKSRKFIDMIQDSNVKTSKTVQHCCLYAEQHDKEYAIGPLIEYFLDQKRGSILVFCQTKRDVDRIGSSKFIPVSSGCLHGDFTQQQRERVFHDFKKGKLNCLVATNVAARGLDFPEIDLIIQMSPPSTTDSYIHRSGRTGRAGKSGICVTIYDEKQEYLMERIQKQAKIVFSHINPDEIWEICANRPPIPNPYERNQQYQYTSHNSYQRNQSYQRNEPYQRPRTENKDQFWGNLRKQTDKDRQRQTKMQIQPVYKSMNHIKQEDPKDRYKNQEGDGKWMLGRAVQKDDNDSKKYEEKRDYANNDRNSNEVNRGWNRSYNQDSRDGYKGGNSRY